MEEQEEGRKIAGGGGLTLGIFSLRVREVAVHFIGMWARGLGNPSVS